MEWGGPVVRPASFDGGCTSANSEQYTTAVWQSRGVACWTQRSRRITTRPSKIACPYARGGMAHLSRTGKCDRRLHRQRDRERGESPRRTVGAKCDGRVRVRRTEPFVVQGCACACQPQIVIVSGGNVAMVQVYLGTHIRVCYTRHVYSTTRSVAKQSSQERPSGTAVLF